MRFTEEQLNKYYDDPNYCPTCGSQMDWELNTDDNYNFIQDLTKPRMLYVNAECKNCGAKISETYELTAVDNVESAGE